MPEFPLAQQLLLASFVAYIAVTEFRLHNLTAAQAPASVPPGRGRDLSEHPKELYFSGRSPRQHLVDHTQLIFTVDELPFAIVADLDKESRDKNKFLWRSYLQRGTLLRSTRRHGERARPVFRVTWGHRQFS